jgi:hypothetical protein
MGFKKTSDTIAISFGLNESAANTFTQEEIALQLDVLNNEIFVVLAVDLNPAAPNLVAASTTETRATVASTSATDIQNLSNTNVLAEASLAIVTDAAMGVSFTRAAEESPIARLDYIGLIATNNFFVSVKGSNNLTAKSVNGRIWGYRARADATTYAALVQSEVLSA